MIELVICFPVDPHPEIGVEKYRLPDWAASIHDLSPEVGNHLAANLHTISCVLAEPFTSPRRKLQGMKVCLL